MNDSESSAGIPADAESLGPCFLHAERTHSRRAVLRWHTAGPWQEVPAWRWHRQVIRMALFLRERMAVKEGERVILASPLRAERVAAEWAAVLAGGAAIAVDPDGPRERWAAAGAEHRPKVVFVSGSADADRWLEASPGVGPSAVVVFDPAGTGTPLRSWTEVLDLGGTLDTSERAEDLRARVRTLPPSSAALGIAGGSAGAPISELWTHEDVLRRLRAFWTRTPPRRRDVAYIAPGNDPGLVCWPLWAFVADGWTRTVLGTPGREAEEIPDVRPDLVVGSAALHVTAPWPATGNGDPAASRGRTAIDRARALVRRMRGASGQGPAKEPRAYLTFQGTLAAPQTGRFQ